MLLRYCFQVCHNGCESIGGLVSGPAKLVSVCVGTERFSKKLQRVMLAYESISLAGQVSTVRFWLSLTNDWSNFAVSWHLFLLFSSWQHRVTTRHCISTALSPFTNIVEVRQTIHDENCLSFLSSLPPRRRPTAFSYQILLQIVRQPDSITLYCLQLRNIRTYLNKI